MSRSHTVKKGDLLATLATKYLNNPSRWTEIKNANPQLNGRKTATDGSPLIYPGDILVIPDDVQQESNIPDNINADADDELSIIVNGNKFIFFGDYTLTQNMDSFDSFTFSAPFEIGEKIYRDTFRPFSYTGCNVYYGGGLFFNGILLAPQSESTTNSKTISITGYPKCGVLNDCCLPITKFPIEFNNQDLQKIANSVCDSFGITTVFSESAGNVFKKVTPEPQTKCLSFLIELADQRGFLITNNNQGNLQFWKTSTGTPIATINEGETPYLSCRPTFNPQQFYSHITGLSKTTATNNAEKFTFENTYLTSKGILRPYNYIINDAEKSDLQGSVKAKAGHMFANACGYELTVYGHRDSHNNLWSKNTFITVLAPGSQIYRDTKFLIKKVILKRDSKNGDTTVLSLVLPGAYNGELPEVVAWEE